MQGQKQKEWHDQWSVLRDDEEFLFKDWIHPVQIEDFQGKAVLECGCGGGQHASLMEEAIDRYYK